MKTIRVFALLIAYLLTFSTAVYGATMRIAYEGNPTSTIILPESPNITEEFAAQELKNHLDSITGGNFRILHDNEIVRGKKIYIGQTAIARKIVIPPPSKEAFSIIFERNAIIINGGGDSGTLFGVYEFLERLGVKWLVPGDLGTNVPSKPTLSVRVENIFQKPAFKLRGMEYGLWGLRNKNNFITDPDLPIQPVSVPRKVAATMEFWVPPEEYYPEFAEYYALVDGSRDPFRFYDGTKALWKTEPSSEGLAVEVADKICKAYHSAPDTPYFLISPMDGDNWSESPESLALDEGRVTRWQRYSRRYFTLYNNIAKHAASCLGESEIIGYAYHYYNCPPLDTELKANSNLSLMITHFNAFDLARPMNDPDSTNNQLFLSCLDGWENIFGRKLFIYEYYWKLNWLGLPWPILHTIAKDIPYLKGRDIQGVISQSSLVENGWTLGIYFYVASKLLWNPDLDPEIVKEEWIKGLFQEASGPMSRYYQIMEESMASQVNIPGDARKNALKVFTPEVISGMEEAYNEAMSLAENDRVIRRIKMVGRSLNYSKRIIGIIRLAQDDTQKAANRLEQFLLDHQQHPQKWNGAVSEQIFPYLENYLVQLRE